MEVVWNLGAALEYLSRMGCRRVLVQLPQGMTHASERFLSAVEDRSMEALLWGRPAYGACDVVDPEAAGADCLLHVGHLPFPWLTPERAVFYVPPTEVDVKAVADALADYALAAVALGISPSQIVLDPGIGFGKTPDHNLAIIANLDKLAALNFPLLLGPSRKSFIGAVLDAPVGRRREGTDAAVAACVLGGAHIVRVHDIARAASIARMCDAIRRARE